MHELYHIFEECVLEAVHTAPFLFLACLLVEYAEHRQDGRLVRLLARGDSAGFAVGAGLGVIPQCGFSGMAASLYAGHIITPGTLLAVFLATSDEAIILIMSEPGAIGLLGKLVAVKLVVAMAGGFITDYIIRGLIMGRKLGTRPEAVECLCVEDEGEENVLKAAALHTLNLLVWVLVISILLHIAMHGVGDDLLGRLITDSILLQPALAALVGLIPNCAASVLLAKLYMTGSISFASLVAGLCSAAGVGLVVLFRTMKNKKRAFLVLGLLYLFSVTAGLVVGLLGI